MRRIEIAKILRNESDLLAKYFLSNPSEISNFNNRCRCIFLTIQNLFYFISNTVFDIKYYLRHKIAANDFDCKIRILDAVFLPSEKSGILFLSWEFSRIHKQHQVCTKIRPGNTFRMRKAFPELNLNLATHMGFDCSMSVRWSVSLQLYYLSNRQSLVRDSPMM